MIGISITPPPVPPSMENPPAIVSTQPASTSASAPTSLTAAPLTYESLMQGNSTSVDGELEGDNGMGMNEPTSGIEEASQSASQMNNDLHETVANQFKSSGNSGHSRP